MILFPELGIFFIPLVNFLAIFTLLEEIFLNIGYLISWYIILDGTVPLNLSGVNSWYKGLKVHIFLMVLSSIVSQIIWASSLLVGPAWDVITKCVKRSIVNISLLPIPLLNFIAVCNQPERSDYKNITSNATSLSCYSFVGFEVEPFYFLMFWCDGNFGIVPVLSIIIFF